MELSRVAHDLFLPRGRRNPGPFAGKPVATAETDIGDKSENLLPVNCPWNVGING